MTWLDGNLDGVDPRAELELIRGTLREAILEGKDPSALIRGLAALDAAACAELVVGSRALADPALVTAALQSAALLETVLPPQGLYRRLLDLVPEALDEVLQVAIERHGGADWVWRLSHAESPPGRSVFAALVESDPAAAARGAMQHRCQGAVLAHGATGHPGVLRVLYEIGPREVLLAALAAALDGGAPGDVVAWVAAWHGPDVDPLFAAVARRLATPAGRARLHMLAADLPMTRALVST
jgi:hypothetical protein